MTGRQRMHSRLPCLAWSQSSTRASRLNYPYHIPIIYVVVSMFFSIIPVLPIYSCFCHSSNCFAWTRPLSASKAPFPYFKGKRAVITACSQSLQKARRALSWQLAGGNVHHGKGFPATFLKMSPAKLKLWGQLKAQCLFHDHRADPHREQA